MIEHEVPGCLPPGVEDSHLRELPPNGPALATAAALLHAEYRDRLVTAVRHDDEPPGLVDAYATARVHRDRERRRHRLDGLDQPQGGTPAEVVQRQAELLGARDLAEQVPVDGEHRDRGAELVDHVRDVEPRVEVDVPRPVRHAGAHTAGEDAELSPERALPAVVVYLPHEVLPKVRHVRDAPLEGIEDQRVGVGVDLPHGDGRRVVVRVIHAPVLLRGRDHLLAGLGIVHVLDGSREFARLAGKRDDYERRIPVVHRDEVTMIPIDGQVAGGGPPGVDTAHFCEAAVVMDLVGEDLAVLLDVLGARVDDVEPVAVKWRDKERSSRERQRESRTRREQRRR